MADTGGPLMAGMIDAKTVQAIEWRIRDIYSKREIEVVRGCRDLAEGLQLWPGGQQRRRFAAAFIDLARPRNLLQRLSSVAGEPGRARAVAYQALASLALHVDVSTMAHIPRDTLLQLLRHALPQGHELQALQSPRSYDRKLQPCSESALGIMEALAVDAAWAAALTTNYAPAVLAALELSDSPMCVQRAMVVVFAMISQNPKVLTQALDIVLQRRLYASAEWRTRRMVAGMLVSALWGCTPVERQQLCTQLLQHNLASLSGVVSCDLTWSADVDADAPVGGFRTADAAACLVFHPSLLFTSTTWVVKEVVLMLARGDTAGGLEALQRVAAVLECAPAHVQDGVAESLINSGFAKVLIPALQRSGPASACSLLDITRRIGLSAPTFRIKLAALAAGDTLRELWDELASRELHSDLLCKLLKGCGHMAAVNGKRACPDDAKSCLGFVCVCVWELLEGPSSSGASSSGPCNSSNGASSSAANISNSASSNGANKSNGASSNGANSSSASSNGANSSGASSDGANSSGASSDGANSSSGASSNGANSSGGASSGDASSSARTRSDGFGSAGSGGANCGAGGAALATSTTGCGDRQQHAPERGASGPSEVAPSQPQGLSSSSSSNSSGSSGASGNSTTTDGASVEDAAEAIAGRTVPPAAAAAASPAAASPPAPAPVPAAFASTPAAACSHRLDAAAVTPAAPAGSGRQAPQQHHCAMCGTTAGRLRRCAGCRVNRYCSDACQRQHWQYGGHKQECALLAAALANGSK